VRAVTAFFVPGVESDQAEARYVELAEMVDAVVVLPANRVLSVRFTRGAEEWTATVGERLSGQLAAGTERLRARRTSSLRTAPTREVSDTATVQAIFDVGDAHLVITDALPVGEVPDSTWDNPFSIPRRDTRRVRRFEE
jgi:hypothetical protein